MSSFKLVLFGNFQIVQIGWKNNILFREFGNIYSFGNLIQKQHTKFDVFDLHFHWLACDTNKHFEWFNFHRKIHTDSNNAFHFLIESAFWKFLINEFMFTFITPWMTAKLYLQHVVVAYQQHYILFKLKPISTLDPYIWI